MENKELTIGIIIVGFNRVNSIKRLLDRLNACDYPDREIPLVVSLDNCGKPNVFEFASAFEWRHGSKEVLLQPERMGCRAHVLHCGSYIERYGWDAAIVLEDDVYPSAAFYLYALQAVAKYRDDDRIAGIALYGIGQDQTVRLPFAPVWSDYDAYFMQLAQSCGQVWMKRQWKAFSDWYAAHSAPFTECPGVPFNVCRWPKTSWLKYHIRYCVETDKYFVYPYRSLTTNFADPGAHTGVRSNVLQVQLELSAKETYRFPELDGAPVVYDAWHENTALPGVLGLRPEELCVDIFGGKKNYEHKRYWLTHLSRPYQVLRSYSLSLYPMDMNVLSGLDGNEIRLYDTQQPAEAPAPRDRDLQVWGYYNRLMSPEEIILKLAKPMRKKIREHRRQQLLHPISLLRTIWGRLKKHKTEK